MTQTSFKIVGAAIFVALSACSAVPTEPAAPEVSAPAMAALVTGAGTWYPFSAASNSTGAFWDNFSDDGQYCNVGFFSSGPFGPCINKIPGAPAAVSFGANAYLGGSLEGYSAPFTFDAGQYEVTFLDGYRGLPNEPIGYFTKSGSGYVKTLIDPASSANPGGVATFTTTAPWGMWIRPEYAVTGGDGCGNGESCTDDSRVQQFVLFSRSVDETFLVGVEDRPGSATGPGIVASSGYFPPTGGGDKDFNDFFMTVHKVPPAETLDGRMTGSGTNKLADVKASITIHCDNKLSNNIEIQGPNKLNWHLDKNSLTNIVCQLSGDPTPPAAPINVFSGNATGTLNGVAGSTLSFKFTDNGEPGSKDRMALKIVDKNNVIVLNVADAFITNGNLQAHFDQPHKK